MLRRELEREMQKKLYSEVLTYEADALEEELKSFEKDPIWAHQTLMKRATKGHKGFKDMNADEIEDYMCCDEKICNNNYIDTLVELLSKEKYSTDLHYLIKSLKEKNLLSQSENKQECPRLNTLIQYLKDINEYEGVIKIEEQKGSKEHYYKVIYQEDYLNTSFKVLTEQECIKELAEWYESDLPHISFLVEEISELLGVSVNMLEPLGLLKDVYGDFGNGTEFLYQTLKKADKLEELASKAKCNDFCYLADFENVLKMDSYYVMEAGEQIS